MDEPAQHDPPTPSSEEEGEKVGATPKAPSSSEEGVGGGGVTRKVLLQRAREMRNNPTEPEKRLWSALRARQLFGYKICRQEVIGFRIVDFFCPAKGLAIEIDGDTHRLEIDLRRDRRMLREFGFRVVRFTNADVMRNCDGVLTALKIALDAQSNRWPNRREHHPPTPTSEEEGEQVARRLKAPSSSEEGVGGGGG
jgi:very-short-patch-repair endonuclease